MNKLALLLLCISAIIFSSDSATAGSIGTPIPADGEDWEIDQYTFVWDETINVRDITVSEDSVTFKLQNVTLDITGKVIIEANTEWISSDITHNTTTNSNLINLKDSLLIKGTNLTINAPEHVFDGSGYQGMRLSTNSKLVITDLDNNPETMDDASIISSMNWNISDPYNTALEFWTNGYNTVVEFSNSIFNHLFAVTTNGNNIIVKNNTFNHCGSMAWNYGNNLVFENNYAYNNSYGWLVDFYGDNALVQNNFVEGSGTGVFFMDSGKNHLIKNNTIKDVPYYGISAEGSCPGCGVFTAMNTMNSTWLNNTLINVDNWGVYFHNATNATVQGNQFLNVRNGIISEGENSTIAYNYFDNNGQGTSCSSHCIVILNGDVTIPLDKVNVSNNTLLNVGDVGIALVNGLEILTNISIVDNYVEGAIVGLLFEDGGCTNCVEGPENLFVSRNVFTNLTVGIRLDASDLTVGGKNYIFYDNNISNSWNGIRLYANEGNTNTFSEMEINNNKIKVNGTGIFISGFVNPKIIGNEITGSAKGIDLAFNNNIEIISNEIIVKDQGILLYDVDGIIRNNNISGNCTSEECDKLFFTKVAEIGIFNELSDLNIQDNKLKLFYTHIETKKSGGNNVFSNELDYGNTGLSFEDSSNQSIQNNIINNNSISIHFLNSFGINVQNNNISYFDKAIYSVNSSLYISTNYYNLGVLCLEFIDSNYSVDNYDNFDCSTAYLYEKYNVKMNIRNDDGEPSANHQFYYHNNRDDTKIYSTTLVDGNSNYILLTTLKIYNLDYMLNFNPHSFYYEHNAITFSIGKEILDNQTITAVLDTTPPQTIVHGNSTLINSDIIYLTFNIIDNGNDIEDFEIQYLENDGIHFSEWKYGGTFNQSLVKFEGSDGTKYRFRSISKDIYGNIESKEGYDYEITIDTTAPTTNFKNLEQKYYFTSLASVLLLWESNDDDIQLYTVIIKYTNFTDEYLDPESVVWESLDSIDSYNSEPFVYQLTNTGHYQFKIIATDKAGNIEEKEPDFILNYDFQSDSITFVNVPERWGSDSINIEYVKANEYLDFVLYLSIETIDSNSENLMWLIYEYDSSSNGILLSGLQDSTRYYLVAKSEDLAGNLEDPLNYNEIFSSNGGYDQTYNLKYLPLERTNYPVIVQIDEDGDGIHEITLASGNNLTKLQNNQYFLDYKSKLLYFGGPDNGGYVPEPGANISISYAGVSSIFEVYTKNPEAANNLQIVPTNISHITFYFQISDPVAKCKIQRTTSPTEGWYNERLIEPCDIGTYNYVEKNPDLKKNYYYRVYSEDEFEHFAISDEISLNMDEMIILYPTAGSNSPTNQIGMEVIIPISILAGIILIFGGVLLFTTRKDEMMDENVNIIESKPVAKYKLEELYLIYSDGRLVSHVSDVENAIDSDIMSGMLTAINDFVQDSFSSEEDLGSIDYGQNKIVLQRGTNYYLAAVVYGETDNFFKGKLANIIRTISFQFPHLKNWDGDASQNEPIDALLSPLMEETGTTHREMVDNYIADIQVSITSQETVTANALSLNLNFSNYSTNDLNLGTVKPIFNDQYLILTGMKPDVLYSFTENKFHVGEIKSYTEVQIELNFKKKVAGQINIDLEFSYYVKDKLNTTTKRVFDGKI